MNDTKPLQQPTGEVAKQIMHAMGYVEDELDVCLNCRHCEIESLTCTFTRLFAVRVSPNGKCDYFQHRDRSNLATNLNEDKPTSSSGGFTKNVPKEPGFYNWRRGPGAQIYLIDIYTDEASGKLYGIFKDTGVKIIPQKLTGEWRVHQISGIGEFTKKVPKEPGSYHWCASHVGLVRIVDLQYNTSGSKLYGRFRDSGEIINPKLLKGQWERIN